MSSTLSLIIASACVNFSGNHHDACSKAIEATGKQSGIERNIGLIEKNAEKRAIQTAGVILGDTGLDIAAGGLYVAKVIADKSVKFGVPTLGLADKIVSQVGKDEYFIRLEWGFK